MKPFLSFLRRRWFRILAGGFFLLLILLYAGFKYIFSESFVQSRVVPSLERGMRRDIVIDSVEGGLVFGFVARGVHFKEPRDMGRADYITVRQVRVRPDWSELLHGRIVISRIEAEGVSVLFRKLGPDRGNWMPDARYPQPPAKQKAKPFKVESIGARDIEYRFIDEVTGFKAVVRVPQFTGSLSSDEQVVVAVHGNWVIDSLVFGKPLDERHIPALGCEGLFTTYSREKRTEMRVSVFKGDHHVVVSGPYNWESDDSYIRLKLENGEADLAGEYFRALFPGFIHLEGWSQYSGTVYKSGPDTDIHIEAVTDEAFVKEPGFDDRPLRNVHQTVDFREDGKKSNIVWDATGTLCPLPDSGACDLPFTATLDYSAPDHLLAVRTFRVVSPGTILDSSGFVWFPEGGRPGLGLEGTGSVDLASKSGSALFSFAGMPLEASMEYRAQLKGPAEAPVLLLDATAPLLSASPEWFNGQVRIAGFTGRETLSWKKEGGLVVAGKLRGGGLSWTGMGAPAAALSPVTSEHEIERNPKNDDWMVRSVEIDAPDVRAALEDPFWVEHPPQSIRFRGRADVGALAALLAPESGAAVEGDLDFDGFWEPREEPVRVSISANGARLEIESKDEERSVRFAKPRIVARVGPGPGEVLGIGFRLRTEDMEAEPAAGRLVSLGRSEVAAGMTTPRGGGALNLRTFELRSPVLILGGTAVKGTASDANHRPDWQIGATGDLRRISGLLAPPESLAATGVLEVSGKVTTEAGKITFDGNWDSPRLGVVMPRSGTLILMQEALGNQWWSYEPGRSLTMRGVIGSSSSFLRSGTREAVLGPAEAGAGLSWEEKESRLDLNQAWLETERVNAHLTGETQLGTENAKSHFNFDVAGPLEVLWPALAGRSATGAIAPGTGDIRVDGEFWRGDGTGRAVFKVTSDELRFGSFAGQTSLAAQAGPQTKWSWEGDIDVGKIIYGNHVSTDHRYHVRSADKYLWIDSAHAIVGDGTVTAFGGADFHGPVPRLSGAFWIQDSDLAAWLPSFVTDATGTVGGIASATAVWSAEGSDSTELSRTLRAQIRAWIKDGYFHHTPVTRSISSILGLDELQNVNIYWADSEMRIEGQTLYIEDLDMETNHYRAEMDGSIGFDGSEDLRMIMNLPIPLASRVPFLFGLERLFPTEVPVGLKFTGTLEDPKVSVFRYSLVERPAGAFGNLIRSFGKLFGIGNGDKEKPEEEKGEP